MQILNYIKLLLDESGDIKMYGFNDNYSKMNVYSAPISIGSHDISNYVADDEAILTTIDNISGGFCFLQLGHIVITQNSGIIPSGESRKLIISIASVKNGNYELLNSITKYIPSLNSSYDFPAIIPFVLDDSEVKQLAIIISSNYDATRIALYDMQLFSI